MLNFCTLFDSNYILFGLNMYYSLAKTCGSFHLYIFAFDDKSYTVLVELKLPHTTILSLSDLEDEDLQRIKPTRNKAEYCWTCTPATVLYSIKKFNLDHCTYVDADLYFYSDPKILVKEMNDNSVLITSHRYTPKYDQSKQNGIYCVQFVTFKNTSQGLKVLQWWRDACIVWCFARLEGGKFGDQKYLDDWPSRFKGVHELQHLGGGVAPWNVQQYDLNIQSLDIYGEEIKTASKFKLVFYHFHGMRLLEGRKVDLCNYALTENTKKIIYHPYLLELEKIRKLLRQKGFNLNLEYNYKSKKNLKKFFLDIKRVLQGSYQIYSFDKIL